MKVLARSRRYWVFSIAGLALCASGYGIGRHLGGRNSRATGRNPVPAAETIAGVLPASPVMAADFGSGAGVPDADAESVIQAQRKRIMGRLRSLEMVRRVAIHIRPLIDRAIEQPAVQGDLRALAASAGMSVEDYRAYFKGKQEGDLLLESGGDPNARSVSNAIGVAQFMVGTGQRCGLSVNLAKSNALSRQIAAVESQMEWLAAQPATWQRPIPPALKGVVPTMPAPLTGGPDQSEIPVPGSSDVKAPEGVWTRDQWLAYRKSQWQNLVLGRRRVDQRFDPARSVTAQTRYLVSLVRRYGGVDWALQAYHGGEAGASRTMRLFASNAPRTIQLASRGGYRRPEGWLPYSDVYAHVSPTATPEAFSYLFGRSDDHRYYWWKVLAAERALNLYRKDPAEFERQWKALKPGQNVDAAWYPEPEALQFPDPDALREAYHQGALVALPPDAAGMGLRTQNLAALEPESTGLHRGLRPEAMGALLRLAHIYRSYGGGSPVTVLSLVQSAEYRAKWDARYPDPPLPPNVPKDAEFHTTGLTFDLQRPAGDWDRKVLEYALGKLYDSLRISWRSETDGGSRRYHVVVNPQFKDEFVDYYHKIAR